MRALDSSQIPGQPCGFQVSAAGWREARRRRGYAVVEEALGNAAAVGVRVISDCHFAAQLNHFMPGSLSYSVAAFLK